MGKTTLWVMVVLAGLSGLAGCQSQKMVKVTERSLERDEAKARALIEEGIAAFELGDVKSAQERFAAALEADAFSGIAHNNLGKVYYHQDRLYLAAKEFQYAAKLLPHHSEPKNNLGLVLEAAGKLDDAVANYDEALAVEPDNAQLLGNLVRARVRRGDEGEEVKALLSDLVMKEDRPEWLSWAREELSRMGTEPLRPERKIDRLLPDRLP